MCTLVSMQACCASAKPFQVQNHPSCLRQWPVKCKIAVVGLRQIIPVFNQQCQVEIFVFDPSAKVLYNYCIDEREWQMTTTNFFADFAYEQYQEFVEAELSEMFQCTDTQVENFEFDDVPF